MARLKCVFWRPCLGYGWDVLSEGLDEARRERGSRGTALESGKEP